MLSEVDSIHLLVEILFQVDLLKPKAIDNQQSLKIRFGKTLKMSQN